MAIAEIELSTLAIGVHSILSTLPIKTTLKNLCGYLITVLNAQMAWELSWPPPSTAVPKAPPAPYNGKTQYTVAPFGPISETAVYHTTFENQIVCSCLSAELEILEDA